LSEPFTTSPQEPLNECARGELPVVRRAG